VKEMPWTVDMLRELRVADREAQDALRQADQKALEAALAAAKEAVAAALAAAEKATSKAEIASGKQFEAVNEFRAQQGDLIQTFARKAEIDIRFKALETQNNRLIGYIFTIVAILIALYAAARGH
jgi:hypothetical protein